MVASCPSGLGLHSKSQFFEGATAKSHSAVIFFARPSPLQCGNGSHCPKTASEPRRQCTRHTIKCENAQPRRRCAFSNRSVHSLILTSLPSGPHREDAVPVCERPGQPSSRPASGEQKWLKSPGLAPPK